MMIQPATPARPAPATGRAAAPRDAARGGAFAQSLTAFLDATGQDDATPPAAKQPDDRQDDAADGNPPPASDTPDPALVWLVAPPPPVVPLPVATIVTAGAAATPTVAGMPTAAAATPPADPTQLATTPPPATPPVPLPNGAAATPPPPVPATETPAAPTDAMPSKTTSVAHAAPLTDTAAPGQPPAALPPAATPPPAPLTVGGTGPAAQLFAAAIHAAGDHDRKADPRATDAASAALAAAPAAIAAPVAAAGGAQGGTLDMQHRGWPSAMVDHIERLRDAADATSTRIRVVPDALGGIDVAVRRDGDGVHVHFSAEQGATRALLTDAGAQLTDIAAQRGLRLSGTSIDAGTGQGSGQRGQPAPAPVLPSAPAAAPRDAAAATDISDSLRIA